MKVYARLDSGIVMELIDVPDELDVKDMFTAEIVDMLVEVTGKEVLPNWSATFSGGKWSFSPPTPVEYSDEQVAAEALAQRDQLLITAAIRIAPLQDAVDLDDATAAEEKLLKQWKQYRVALNRLDQQAGFPRVIQWPNEPS